MRTFALASIDLTATGEPEDLDITLADSSFTITGGAIDLISLRNDRRVWESSLAQTFPILSLTSTDGVAIDPSDAMAFNVASFDFKANNLQLINPNGGDTSDSEAHIRGDFDFNSVLGDLTTTLPTVTVAGKDYVATSPDISPTLSGATFNVPVYKGVSRICR